MRNSVAVKDFQCVGCTACYVSCPTDAIKMVLNPDGFYEPGVDADKCIDCGKCRRICPACSPAEQRLPIEQYACWHNNADKRYSSTSGGTFAGVAEWILEQGGVVFGAVYDDDFMGVHHASTENTPLQSLQKSKYTVSDLRDTFPRIIELAKQNRFVLFVGTPCQCAGLAPLVKQFDNVYTADFICGGTPSAKCYKEYMEGLKKKFKSPIKSVDFRGKDTGWHKQYLKVEFENGKKYHKFYLYDYYYTLFYYNHISTRQACTNCIFRKRHLADLTLADFWGYRNTGVPDTDQGISLVAINSPKGKFLFNQFKDKTVFPLTEQQVAYAYVDYTPTPAQIAQKERFLADLRENDFNNICNKYADISKIGVLIKRIKSRIKK